MSRQILIDTKRACKLPPKTYLIGVTVDAIHVHAVCDGRTWLIYLKRGPECFRYAIAPSFADAIQAGNRYIANRNDRYRQLSIWDGAE